MSIRRKHSTYENNVRRIVTKRLEKAGIDVNTPELFFPNDEDQETTIIRIGQEILHRWSEEGRGHRPSDDVTRYARPEFIRRLGGTAKSTSSYSYAGFAQLVHISSGQVRYFLEPAAEMYDEAISEAQGRPVKFIRPTIQNATVRQEAEKLMFNDSNDCAKIQII